MAIPDFIDYGAPEIDAGVGSNNAARTPNLPPTFSIGQCLILFISSDGAVPTLQTANGWTLAEDPAGNQAAVAIAGQTSMAVYWKRATAARTGGGATSESAPIINDPNVWGGTCFAAHINLYSNVRSSDTPFHKVLTSTLTSASTAVSVTLPTTTIADCLMMGLASSANDDSTFNSWGSVGGMASPSPTIDSGWHTATGNDTAWSGGRGGRAAVGTPSPLTTTFGASTQQARIGLAIASLAEPGTSGTGAITLGTLTAVGAGSVEMIGDASIALGALTAQGADVPTANATITLDALTAAGAGEVDVTGAAAITLGAATVASTATGPAVWSVGAATVKQRANAFGPSTGTLTTDAVTTTTGSILIAFIARGKWDLSGVPSPKGPTDSQGNTWTAVSPGDQGYGGFPDSRFGLWWCINNAGSASHTFSAAWGPYGTGAPGNPGDEVTVGMVELLSNGELQMIDSTSHVERAVPTTTVTGVAVTPTGPSITFCMLAGNGPVGQTHAFTLTAGAIAAGWANVAGASANGDLDPNGYIQSWPAVLIDQAGAKTGAAQNIAATGVSSEGAQVFQFVLQHAAGIIATSAITLGAATVSGDAAVPVLGDASIALSAATVSSTAELDIAGAAGLVLGAVAIAATSDVDVAGAATVQLGALTITGAGTIETTTLEGDAAITLGALAVSGDAFSAALTADAAITLGALRVAGASSLPSVEVGAPAATATVQSSSATATVVPANASATAE